MIFYNEFNPESAAMISQFMTDGLIPSGIVDKRSITEIDPDELKRYTQCHFFAGIAGWTFALQLAGWSSARPVWTGSCPCQPFSSAGSGGGINDERHLWPVWERLISECRPASIYGEQVASAIAYGWLDDVYQGLEKEGYAIGSAILPACSVGAPHKRDRLWFVAHADFNGRDQGRGSFSASGGDGLIGNCGTLAYTECGGSSRSRELGKSSSSEACIFGQTSEPWDDCSRHWQGSEWIDCPDKKKRLIEPGICLLADGVQFRRPILHAIGNAIVPQVAAKFIQATM